MSDEDFWLDMSSNSEDVSEGGDIPLEASQSAQPSAPATPSPKRNPRDRRSTPRRKDEPGEALNIRSPVSIIEPTIVIDDSESGSDEMSQKGEVWYQRMKDKIRRDIQKLQMECAKNDDAPIVAKNLISLEEKLAGEFTIVFEDPDGAEFERILHKEQSLADLIQGFPQKLRECAISIDGVVWNPESVTYDLLSDYTKVKLEIVVDTMAAFRRLSFAMPNGEKVKIRVDENSTFGDILAKLSCNNARLFFDGYELDLNQRVVDNDELEDGEQIDVKV